MAHLSKTKPIPVSARIYELERIPLDQFPKIFGALLASDKWHELMDRRNKFAKAIKNLRTGSAEADKAFKEIIKVDEKAAGVILATLVNCYLDCNDEVSMRKVTLSQFKEDFVNTPEKEEAYEAFNARLDQANFLVDIVDTLVADARSELYKIDPTALLTEFDSLKQVQSILTDYSQARHKGEHPELFDCFIKYCDEISDFVRLKSALFNKECKDIRRDLEARGELKKGTNIKKEKLY